MKRPLPPSPLERAKALHDWHKRQRDEYEEYCKYFDPKKEISR